MGKLSSKKKYPACSGFFYDVLEKLTSDRKNIVLAVLSGLLLTGSFPKIEIDWLSWFALVPLLYALKELSPKGSFHQITLTYCPRYYEQVLKVLGLNQDSTM